MTNKSRFTLTHCEKKIKKGGQKPPFHYQIVSKLPVDKNPLVKGLAIFCDELQNVSAGVECFHINADGAFARNIGFVNNLSGVAEHSYIADTLCSNNI